MSLSLFKPLIYTLYISALMISFTSSPLLFKNLKSNNKVSLDAKVVSSNNSKKLFLISLLKSIIWFSAS